jgi:hypothetical protein
MPVLAGDGRRLISTVIIAIILPLLLDEAQLGFDAGTFA